MTKHETRSNTPMVWMLLFFPFISVFLLVIFHCTYFCTRLQIHATFHPPIHTPRRMYRLQGQYVKPHRNRIRPCMAQTVAGPAYVERVFFNPAPLSVSDREKINPFPDMARKVSASTTALISYFRLDCPGMSLYCWIVLLFGRIVGFLLSVVQTVPSWY